MTIIVISNYHILVDGKYYTTLDYKAYSKDDTIGICHHTNKDDTLIKGRVAPAEISLNGTVYPTAEAFVDAFNAITIAALSYLLTSMKANTDYPNTPFSARITADTEVHIANYAYPGYVTIKAHGDNAGNVYIGAAGLGAGSGQLAPGESVAYESDDLSLLYALNVSAGDDIDVFGAYRL